MRLLFFPFLFSWNFIGRQRRRRGSFSAKQCDKIWRKIRENHNVGKSFYPLFCLSILTRWVLTNWITEKLVLQLATAQCVKIVQNKSHFHLYERSLSKSGTQKTKKIAKVCLHFQCRSPFNTLFLKSNFCPKIQFWQNPNIFTSFSPNIFFDNFSREIKDFNS